MTNYTTRPSAMWPDYITILADGSPRMSVRPERVEAAIEEIKAHSLSFWTERINETGLVVAAGRAYSIGSEHDDPKGFGGVKWCIRFFDGRVVTTTSLWGRGDVPAEFRDQLPDNATVQEIGR
jgi:hypothetical protein